MHYLFIFQDDSIQEVFLKTVVSFKDAILTVADYHGEKNDLFKKSLNGFEDSDTDGMIALYNHFSCNGISNVFVIEKQIY